jgi:sortase A
LIDIPSIKLRSPIVEGVALSNLEVGIGHFPGTPGIGKTGNSVFAGHRSYTFGSFFNRLDELKNGDSIYLQNMKSRFEYIVYDKSLVLPEDISVLDNTEKQIITLITCHPIYSATHRLIIRASLKE